MRSSAQGATKRLIGLMLLASSCFAQPAVKCGFELQGNVIFVKGAIGNAKALDLVLDSGSARTSFDESLATSLNWDLGLKAVSATPNGPQELSVLKDLEIHRRAGADADDGRIALAAQRGDDALASGGGAGGLDRRCAGCDGHLGRLAPRTALGGSGPWPTIPAVEPKRARIRALPFRMSSSVFNLALSATPRFQSVPFVLRDGPLMLFPSDPAQRSGNRLFRVLAARRRWLLVRLAGQHSHKAPRRIPFLRVSPDRSGGSDLFAMIIRTGV